MDDRSNETSVVDNSHAPKYITVYDSIRSDIILKKYQEGAYLPSEAQLIKDYGVSRNTIRHAIKMLSDDGLVKAIQGSGVKVLGARENPSKPSWSAHRFSPEFLLSGVKSVTPPAVEKIPATVELAEILCVPLGTTLYRLQYIWKLDGEPFNYHIQYLNRTLVPGIHRYINQGPNFISLVKERWGLECDCLEEYISCKNADFIEANLLGTEVGAALLYTTRIASCKEGVIEYSEHYGNPKYRRYTVKLL